MDFGCYTIQWCRWIVGALLGEDGARAPQISRSEIIEGEPGIDLRADVEMHFGSNDARELNTRFSCDMRDGVPFRAFVRLTAGDKRLHFENPLNVNGAHLTVTDGDKEERFQPQGQTTYGGQLRAFVHALRTGVAPPNTGAEIIETQALLDECYRNAGVISRRDLRRKALEASDEPGPV
jgi:predicted dehydrogenase